MLDELNQEKYRREEQELQRRRRPRSQLQRMKDIVRQLKMHVRPRPDNWD